MATLIIASKEAMSLAKQPRELADIGAGPIGMEFGYFYNAIGTRVTLVEMVEADPPRRGRRSFRRLTRACHRRG